MTTAPTTRRPAATHLIRRPTPDVQISGDTLPLAQITIYEQLVLYCRRAGAVWRQYPIDADALTAALSNLPQHSGLLPAGTLGVGQVHGVPFAVRHVPAHTVTLLIDVPVRTALKVALPPLIWAGCGTDYRIFALADDTALTVSTPLCVPPFPNTYADGRICWGTSDPRPAARAATLDAVLQLFLTGSAFNTHVAGQKSRTFPASVLAMWEQVAAAGTAYPLDDLLPSAITLGQLVEGRAWAV